MAAFDNQSLSDDEAKELSDLEEHIDDLTLECQDRIYSASTARSVTPKRVCSISTP